MPQCGETVAVYVLYYKERFFRKCMDNLVEIKEDNIKM